MNLSGAIDTTLDRLIAPGFSAIGYAVRRRLPSWPADPPPGCLAGQQWIVTGASSGLGARNAEDLAALGATVHLVVRNAAKTEALLAHLRASYDGGAELWVCDVSDLDSVRSFTAAYLASGRPLHGMIHNAGLLPPTREVSPQGLELTMALHVVGPTLMTEELVPALRGHDARIIFVTSGGMYGQALPVADPNYTQGEYAGAKAYARSKRTQVELLPVLGRRWATAGVRVYATHPGWAATPGVDTALPVFRTLTGPFLRDVAAGADTTTWLAAVQPRPQGGGLWHDRQERPTSLMASTVPTEGQRAEMWEWVAAAMADPVSDPAE